MQWRKSNERYKGRCGKTGLVVLISPHKFFWKRCRNGYTFFFSFYKVYRSVLSLSIEYAENKKYTDQNLFNDERKEPKHSEEEDQVKNNKVRESESEQIKNASAAGMGALERSNENQIKNQDQVDNEAGKPAY